MRESIYDVKGGGPMTNPHAITESRAKALKEIREIVEHFEYIPYVDLGCALRNIRDILRTQAIEEEEIVKGMVGK
jgi:hypothetical protein